MSCRTVAKLSAAQVSRALASLPGWKREGDYISKDFKFRTFLAGIKFVNEVSMIAESVEHHPDIHVVWTTVTMKIQTHEESGITKLDVDLATRIEKHFARTPSRSSR